jgi:hypothetical protein
LLDLLLDLLLNLLLDLLLDLSLKKLLGLFLLDRLQPSSPSCSVACGELGYRSQDALVEVRGASRATGYTAFYDQSSYRYRVLCRAQQSTTWAYSTYQSPQRLGVA